MKNFKITVAAVGLLALAFGCRMNQRHVVIAEDDNHKNLKIEYGGRAVFNYDSTAIAKITPNGFVKYKKDDQAFVAESDNNGKITYRINGSEKQTQLNADDKVFLAQAVKDMIKRGHYND
jgi:di/tripeptidase